MLIQGGLALFLIEQRLAGVPPRLQSWGARAAEGLQEGGRCLPLPRSLSHDFLSNLIPKVDRRLKTVCEQFISTTSATMLHLVTDLNSRMSAFVKVVFYQ